MGEGARRLPTPTKPQSPCGGCAGVGRPPREAGVGSSVPPRASGWDRRTPPALPPSGVRRRGLSFDVERETAQTASSGSVGEPAEREGP
jgi:hypothetical protein